MRHRSHSPSVKSAINQSGNRRKIWESTFGKSLPSVRVAVVLVSAVLALLVVGLGDHDTLEMFQQLVVHEEQSPVKKALERAIIPLKHRLTEVAPDKQADWAHWDTVCWRTFRETPLPRRVDGEKRLAAETLHMQGWRFSREYLEYKLSSADLLGIALIGLQKETWAVLGLKEYATLKGSLGDFSRSSLAKMGTSEALRALEDALVPGGYSRANTHLTMILEIYGDKASAEFMKNLSADQQFSEDERASFEHAYKIIVKRLADINEDGAEDIAVDFQQALAMVPEEPKWPSGIMYYDMQEAADTFVSKHNGTPAIGFLQARLQDPNADKLALLCLAKLAATDSTAEEALYEAISAKDPYIAVAVIGYLERSDSRRIAETFLNRPGPTSVRCAVADLLGGIGDQNTLETLKQMQSVEKYSSVKEHIESAIANLEYRLMEVPSAQQAEWARYETLCWRTLHESPRSRKVHSEKGLAVQTLHMQGRRFTRGFLEYKLESDSILAVGIVGMQKESWAVPELAKYATRKGILGDFARGGLARIGTDESLQVIEDSIVPGGHSRANRHLMRLLRRHGDRASAALLRELASDVRFSEAERLAITRAYEIIEEGLADINGDGEVDFADFALIAAYWRGNNSY